MPADVRAQLQAKPGTREVALHLYREGSPDFADCLHIDLAAQAGELPLWTFDRRAGEIGGARMIGS